MLAMLMAALTLTHPPREVVLSTDCGASIDDQWALVHLAVSPSIRLKGVVTTHAPSLAKPAAESSAKSAREVLACLDLQGEIPVIAGSGDPLPREGKPAATDASRFLIEMARDNTADHRLTVVMIGAATDVAAALLIDPSWADRVEIVAMAFDDWPDGGDPWNVKNDVRAWQAVLESPAPLVVGDSRVCRRHLTITPESAKARFADRGKAGAYLARTFDEWLSRHANMAREETGDAKSWPIWDEVAVAHLLGMTKQEVRPRPTLRDDRTFRHEPTTRTITWITGVDAGDDGIWADLAGKLSRQASQGR